MSPDSVSGNVPVIPPARRHARDALAPFPLSALAASVGIDPSIPEILRGVGIERCEDLAVLTSEAIEIRLGAEGVKLWQLARGNERWRPPPSPPRALPSACFDWTDYVLRDVERMLFVIHSLLGSVCESLRMRGEGTSGVTLSFALDNRTNVERVIGSARPSANQTTWMRLIRLALENLRLPDAVTGLTVSANDSVPVRAKQGDMFDRGFATVHAAESAVAELLDAQLGEMITLAITSHSLPEQRTQAVTVTGLALARPTVFAPHLPQLQLQRLENPVPLVVTTTMQHGQCYPVRFTERASGKHYDIVTAAGPDEISGGLWEETSYTRIYFHCVLSDGRLVLLFRDMRDDGWYLQGWWD